MTAYEQRSYAGGAADSVLTADITNVATAFSVTAGTGAGYPDGTGGPFFVIIDYDNSKAEKVRCSGRVNDTFTVAGTGGGRGQDGTSAQAHAAPAKVRAVWTATDAQEANRAAANTIGKVTSKGDLLVGTGANTLARVAAGTNGQVVSYDSTQTTGVKAFTLPMLGSWSTYAPVWTASVTNPTFGAGDSLIARYKQVDKTILLHWSLNVGTTGWNPGVGNYTLNLPPGLPISGSAFLSGSLTAFSGTNYSGTLFGFNGGTTFGAVCGTSLWGAAAPAALVSGNFVAVTAIYEID